MKGLVDYVPGTSVFHKMNPVSKLIFSMAVCASCFISSSAEILVLLLAVDIATGILCGISARTFRLLKGLVKISVFLFILLRDVSYLRMQRYCFSANCASFLPFFFSFYMLK